LRPPPANPRLLDTCETLGELLIPVVIPGPPALFCGRNPESVLCVPGLKNRFRVPARWSCAGPGMTTWIFCAPPANPWLLDSCETLRRRLIFSGTFHF